MKKYLVVGNPIEHSLSLNIIIGLKNIELKIVFTKKERLSKKIY